jgi:hypothetical protein
MSIRAIQAVWDRTTTGGSTRLLLLALADFADEDGLSWPSVQTLAHRTGRSERQVQRLIGYAIAAGELEADRDGGRGSSRYRLRPGGQPVTERGVTQMSPQGRRPRHPRGDTGDTPGVTPTTPEPSREPTEEPASDPARARELELQDAEERLRALAEPAGPTAAELAAGGAADPVVRYHELTARFPSERIREWLNDVASTWGDERTADALTEAYRRDTTHRGLIARAVDVMNEQEHEAERASRRAREIVGLPERPEQSDEERAAILERNRLAAAAARGQLLADGLVAPTREGDQELLEAAIESRRRAEAMG